MQKLALEGKPTHTNSLGMQFVRIEPGSFMMGSEDASLSDELIEGKAHLRDGDWDEKPGHQVTLTTPFYIGIFQVTNAQYAAFDPTHRDLQSLQNVGFSQKSDEAVVFVDWHDATRFCEWLSEKRDCRIGYRLKRNGNMSVEQEQRRIFIPEIHCHQNFIKTSAKVGIPMLDGVVVQKK